jgi:hypothetical protein
MTFDRRRVMLWVVLVVSTMYTSYTFISRRSAASRVRPAAAAQPAPAAQSTSAAPASPDAAAPAPVNVVSPPAPPLAQSELTAWRAKLGSGERDPFFTLAEIDAMNRPVAAPRPVEAPPPAPATYIVKLIMMQGSEGRALIDGRVVRTGDMIGDERVVEIVPDAVVLERGRSRRSLPLAKSSSSGAVQLERTR